MKNRHLIFQAYLYTLAFTLLAVAGVSLFDLLVQPAPGLHRQQLLSDGMLLAEFGSRRSNPIKYEAPFESVPHWDLHPDARHLLRDITTPVYFTEGIKKSDAAWSRGLLCVSITSVWMFMRRPWKLRRAIATACRATGAASSTPGSRRQRRCSAVSRRAD